MNTLLIRKSLGCSSIKLENISYPVRYFNNRVDKQSPLLYKYIDIKSVLHPKSGVICKKPCVVIQQIRLLKYSNFGHRTIRTPTFTIIWYYYWFA